MSEYNKDAAIAAQNAGTTAASLVQSIVSVTEMSWTKDEVVDLFNDLRTEVFNGTLALAGAEAFVEAVESSRPAPREGGNRGGGRSNFRGGNARRGGGGGGSANPAEVTVNFGRHSGETIGDIFNSDPDYVEWLRDNAQNDFIARIAGEFLANAA